MRDFLAEFVTRDDPTEPTQPGQRVVPSVLSGSARKSAVTVPARVCGCCGDSPPVMLAMAPARDRQPWFLCGPCWRGAKATR